MRSEWAGPALVRPGRRPASPRLRNGCFWWKLPTRLPWTGTPCQVGQVGQVVGKRAEVRNSVNLQIPPRDPMSSWARWAGCGKEGGGEEFHSADYHHAGSRKLPKVRTPPLFLTT